MGKALDALIGCDAFGQHVRCSMARGGFGQFRWYGATDETLRHSDGFDGVGVETGEQLLGRTRLLLRLGGSGYLRLHWEKSGGRTGRLALVLHHGDLVLMSRGVSGTLPSGLQRDRHLTVTHRAGGLAAQHAPNGVRDEFARSKASTARSFV